MPVLDYFDDAATTTTAVKDNWLQEILKCLFIYFF